MARIQFSDKTKAPLQFDEPQTRRRLTQEDIEKGLGAELVGTLPTGDNPMVAFALRDELLRRLRSTGGRPALDGTDVRHRVPMRSSKWYRLEQIAKEFETETFHPTATQVAALFLEFAIDGYDRKDATAKKEMRQVVGAGE